MPVVVMTVASLIVLGVAAVSYAVCALRVRAASRTLSAAHRDLQRANANLLAVIDRHYPR